MPARRPRVCFLDIDGVLNSTKWWMDRRHVEWINDEIDPRAVALLNQIAPAESTRIVVSSTWRLAGLEHVRGVLESVGVQARVVDVTPDLWAENRTECRGKEISHWLQENSHRVGAYVVIDDDMDAGVGHAPRFIKTHVTIGLTEEHVSLAHKIFERDENLLEE